MTSQNPPEPTKATSARARCRSPCPTTADASLYFIGRIRTPWKARKDCPKNARAARESGVVCTIELDPRWARPLLKDIETCSHLSCSTGWTGRGAISRSRCPGNTATAAAPSRCARRCGPIRSR